MEYKQSVPRYQQMDEIIDTFNIDYPLSTVYMLSNVRGSGNWLESNAFSVYRSRLLRKGVLVVSRGYGKIEFDLPYFKEFVLNRICN